jgi:predicted transcriptional regulator
MGWMQMPRLNVDFSDELNAVLEDLAEKQSTTKAEILRRSISLSKFFQEARDAQSKILVKRKDGDTLEVLPL